MGYSRPNGICGAITPDGHPCRQPGPGPCLHHGGPHRTRAKRQQKPGPHWGQAWDIRTAYEQMFAGFDAEQHRAKLCRWLANGGGEAFEAFAERINRRGA